MTRLPKPPSLRSSRTAMITTRSTPQVGKVIVPDQLTAHASVSVWAWKKSDHTAANPGLLAVANALVGPALSGTAVAGLQAVGDALPEVVIPTVASAAAILQNGEATAAANNQVGAALSLAAIVQDGIGNAAVQDQTLTLGAIAATVQGGSGNIAVTEAGSCHWRRRRHHPERHGQLRVDHPGRPPRLHGHHFDR